jgi:hypothetical protein
MPGIMLRSLVALILVLPTALQAQAATAPVAIAGDLAPRSGYLVRPAGDEFLIDLDARQQIAVGDVFSVVVPGEPVVHPVTKALLGSQDTVKGILQVTRVKAGYSYCRALAGAGELRSGDAIRRFQNIDALFWDYRGEGEPYLRELQEMLPHLQWQGYAAAQKGRPAHAGLPAAHVPALYLILTGRELEVRAPDFSLLYSYPAPTAGASAAAQPAPAAQPLASAPAARFAAGAAPVRPGLARIASPADPGESAGEGDLVSRVLESEVGSYWASPTLKGTPVGLEVGDFDGDGQQEIAVAFSDRLEISRLVRGSFQQLAVLPLESSLRAYHLDGADLDKSGRMQLFVSAVTGSGTLSGVSVQWQQGSYQITRTKIPWHLRSIALPGEGVALVGQRPGVQGREYAGPLFRVAMSGRELSEGKPVEAPGDAILYNFTPLVARGAASFASLSEDGYLKLSDASGQELAGSVEKTGGSETYLEMTEESQTGGENRVDYLPARIEVSPRGELLVPANSGSSVLSRVRNFSRSQLQAYSWDGSKLREAWHTNQEKGSLADFRLAEVNNDGELRLVTLVGFPERGLFPGVRKAGLQVYSVPKGPAAQGNP